MHFLRKGIFKYALVVLAVCALATSSYAAEERYSALIIDADTGVVLHQENAGKTRYPASLAKMMTAYLTFHALSTGKVTLNTPLRVSTRAANQAPTSLGLRPGDSVAVKDALNAIIIKSANDAAVVLAEGIGGSEAEFAALMTRTARKLGMNHTNFANASGLPNPKQVTTAYDLARLAVALRRDYPNYYPMFARSSFSYKGNLFPSHNRVTKSYRGADGLKTGYIRASGFNLVTSVKRGGKSLVGVVMGGRTAKSRDAQMMKLLDQAFYTLAKSDGGSRKAGQTSIEASNPSYSSNTPIPKLRDPFAPGIKVSAADENAEVIEQSQNQWLQDYKPVRVKVRGKNVPLPMLRPFSQEKGIVVNSINPPAAQDMVTAGG